jgi:hypothetical protein
MPNHATIGEMMEDRIEILLIMGLMGFESLGVARQIRIRSSLCGIGFDSWWVCLK